MTSNKVIKIATVVLMVLIVVAMLSPIVFGGGDMDPRQFVGRGNTGGADVAAGNVIGAIIRIVQVVGVGVAVIMLIVLAIKYIAAAPSDKAEIKKHAVVYVVGAVVLFAAAGILEIIRQFAGNVSGTPGTVQAF